MKASKIIKIYVYESIKIIKIIKLRLSKHMRLWDY